MCYFKSKYTNTGKKNNCESFFFTHQWTRQPSPFSRDSWMNMMLSLKY